MWILLFAALTYCIINAFRIADAEKKIKDLEESLDFSVNEILEEMDKWDNHCLSKVRNVLEILEKSHRLQWEIIDEMTDYWKLLWILEEQVESVKNQSEFEAQAVFDVIMNMLNEEPEETCPKAKTCKKKPCKDSCPKKGRPTK